MSDGAQIQEQAAWQHIYLQHLKQIKVIKEKKVETKWILLSKM